MSKKNKARADCSGFSNHNNTQIRHTNIVCFLVINAFPEIEDSAKKYMNVF